MTKSSRDMWRALADKIFPGHLEGIGRQDISRALLQKDGSGDQDRPFWRSTRTHKQVDSLMEMAQVDPARVHGHLCVQHGHSIATIAHANSIIDEHDDLSFISELVYLDESTHANDFPGTISPIVGKLGWRSGSQPWEVGSEVGFFEPKEV